MIYFYEKIDLLFEVFSPYEFSRNKKRLFKNIKIWISQSLYENEANKDIFDDLCLQINAQKQSLAKQFSIDKIPPDDLVFFKVRSALSARKSPTTS